LKNVLLRETREILQKYDLTKDWITVQAWQSVYIIIMVYWQNIEKCYCIGFNFSWKSKVTNNFFCLFNSLL
jgi:hypothetical protein